MRVLVLGASGFIGFPAAQALSRAGHQVFGVTRSESKAKLLAADEIIPIVGEPKDSQIWTDLVPTLDVVIDAVGGAEIGTLGEALFNAARSAAESARTAGAPRLTYIYTSGTWVHGDNRHGDAQVSDTSALATPTPLTAWRIPHEQRVTRDTVLNGIVIRPSLLYGKSGSILAALFAGAAQGKVSWPGRPGGRWAVIHTDDLADVYVRACERAPAIGGLIFDAANDFTESVEDILSNLVRVSGAQGPYELREPTNAWEEALACTSLLKPYLARSLLGWQPKKMSLVEGLSLYYAAWKAVN